MFLVIVFEAAMNMEEHVSPEQNTEYLKHMPKWDA